MNRSLNFCLPCALALTLAVAGLFPNNSLGQNTGDVQVYIQKARTAYREKNFAAMIENLKLALRLRPNYGRYIYNIAAAYALSGNKDEAIDWLNRLADMGLVYQPAASADFASLKDTDAFKAIVKRFEENTTHVGNSTPAFIIHEKGLVPEGIAFDPVEKTFYVGSVYKRKIVAINSAGEAKDFSLPADGLWSVMGMRVDAARRLLWVCTASHSQMMNFNDREKGVSGIFKYDLRTKKLIKKYLVPAGGKDHWLGDLVLNSRGDVFASDSVSPAIYLLDHKKDTLEPFLVNEAFVNPQGLAISADEKHLFMADYLKGIFIIDFETKNPTLLTPAPGSTMLGLDGLYFHQSGLIGVQNGVTPNRLVQLTLSKDLKSITRFKVLEANNSIFDEPTLAVVVGRTLYYNANSQWGMIDDKGGLAAEEKLREAVVLKLKL